MLLDLGVAFIVEAVVIPRKTWECMPLIRMLLGFCVDLKQAAFAWLSKTSLASAGIVIEFLVAGNTLMQGVKYIIIIPRKSLWESWLWSIWI